MSEWPKRVTHYVHSDKESNYDLGAEIGLSDKALTENFRYCCYELMVDMMVNEDGTYEILKVTEK